MIAGSRLRQARERLGLTYREVEQATFELASQRGRSEFIIHISRLADIENHGVTPSLHKLYSLSAVYHLDPLEVFSWYDIPLKDNFRDGAHFPGSRTHPAAPPTVLRLPMRMDPAFDVTKSALLTRMVESWGHLEAALLNGHRRYCYAYVGLGDRWMEPLIRAGSLLLVDPASQQVENTGWKNEYERPVYFVDVRQGYRCTWCLREADRLILQPHPLSAYVPEVRKYPGEAEIVGRVVAVAMRLAQS